MKLDKHRAGPLADNSRPGPGRGPAWLVKSYQADVDVDGMPAARCYRCGVLLTVLTITVDRIIPGCQGGTYRRNNIRPACATCNSSTGGRTRGKAA